MNRTAAVSLLLLASACGEQPRCRECGGPRGMAGSPSPVDARCEAESTREALAWDATSELGSPEEAFGGAERSCETDFRWNGAPFDDRAIEPRTGQTRVTVGLVLDHASARLARPQARARASIGCANRLEVDGRVELVTADETFRMASDVTLTRTDMPRSLIYQVIEDVAARQGSLPIELHDGERGLLIYRIDGSGTSCAGEVILSFVTEHEGGEGRLAEWSDSGCALGEEPVDLTAPLAGEGRSLVEAIARVWGHATFSGVWFDGTAAELDLRVEPSGDLGCRELQPTGAIVIPVRATYGTSDGRLPNRTVDASVRATVSGDGRIQQLSFWLSDLMACVDEHDALDYPLADCSAVESATVQVGLNIPGSSGVSRPSDNGLNVYFMQRRGNTPPMNHLLAL